MESSFAVTYGIWKIEQKALSRDVHLFKYGHEVESWTEERLLTWDELYETMLRKSYEHRREE